MPRAASRFAKFLAFCDAAESKPREFFEFGNDKVGERAADVAV